MAVRSAEVNKKGEKSPLLLSVRTGGDDVGGALLGESDEAGFRSGL